MYKILIKYSDKSNVWQFYGNTTTSTTASTSFKEFETDDVETLKTEVMKLDSMYGNNAIRIVEDVTLKYSVDIVSSETTDSVPENTENNEEQNSGEQL